MLLGTPSDSVFEAAEPPHLVVLDVSSAALDPEPELDFARRVHAQHPECSWILVAEPVSLGAAELLFDALDAQTLRYPANARTLQNAVTTALHGVRPLPLSRRIARDRLSARFSRWFGQGEPAELALALEPQLAAAAALARGEPGTGRGLLLRYAHSVSTPAAGPFVRVACTETTRSDQLLAQIEAGVREAGDHAHRPAARLGLWLEDVDRLTESVQARTLDWIEFGLPRVLPASVRRSVRWLASAGVDPNSLDPRLTLAFAEHTIRTRSLRSQPQIIEAFVADTTRAWSAARREVAKVFDAPALDLLRGEPWPGNLAELEALILRSLAHANPEADTIRIADLRFEPYLSPGTLLETPPEGADPRPPSAASRVVEPRPPDSPPQVAAVDLPNSSPSDADQIARLAAAVAHEVRNPLVSIRTFSELLDEHYAEEDFRARFGQLVGEDIRRIEAVVARLEQIGESASSTASAPDETLDMTALLEGLIDEQRATIQAKRLLVLKELDREHPDALGSSEILRPALAGLLAQAIEEVPDRGDLYLASSHHAASAGRAGLRILFRYRVAAHFGPGLDDPARPTLRETVLDHVGAESAIQSLGGTLTIDTTQAEETLIVIDLPAPPLN
jgi:DNA-binding NtrC family response regulator